jgi:K+-dependent Na+/Ca+ exchanger related-protein
LTWIELIIGLGLLLGGGEALVKGSVSLATRLGVSQLMIGLTLVGFGTSMPELVSSIQAVLRGAPEIAVGNVIGSNIANVLLILGCSALILPIATRKEAFRRDGVALIGASLLLLVVALSGEVGLWEGVLLLMLLAGYLGYTYVTERTVPDASAEMHGAHAEAYAGQMSVWLALVLAVGGISGVVFGADLLIGAAIELAPRLGLSEAVVGLTLVAVGTSMPEFATSVMAAIRGKGDVAFGNVVGSNIFNALGILGGCALISPVTVSAEFLRFDVWVMAGTAVLLVVFAATGWRLSRREGGAFLTAYGLYLVAQLATSGA